MGVEREERARLSEDQPTSGVVVRDDPDSHSYVVDVEGKRVGKTVYHMRQGRHVFVHTEVDDAHEGRGIGSKLVRSALDDVRAKGGKVVVLCPFVTAFMSRHPEYQDLIDREMTAMLDGSS